MRLKTAGELVVEGLTEGTSVSSSSLSKKRTGDISLRIHDPCSNESATTSAHGDVPVEVIVVRNAFPDGPILSDLVDGSSLHFLNQKVALRLDRKELERQYLLPLGYHIVLPDLDPL